jgi:hypothetical protein
MDNGRYIYLPVLKPVDFMDAESERTCHFFDGGCIEIIVRPSTSLFVYVQTE